MFLNSIRWQIQIWHGFLLTLLLTGLTFGFYHFERFARLRELDQELQTLLTPILPRVAPPPRRPRMEGGENLGEPARNERWPLEDAAGRMIPFSDRVESGQFYYQVWSADREVTTRSAGAPPGLPYPEGDEVNAENPLRTRDGFRELIHRVPSGHIVLVGASIARIEAELARLAWHLAAAGAGVLALGLAGGWWLANRAIRPIASISATADQIARGHYSRRISIPETQSELGQLAGVLNHTFDQLEKSLEQQRRFTADASHELRTPVSVILNEVQLARTRDRSPEYYQNALATCERAAERMRKLVNSLLELARADAGDLELSLVQCDLSRIAREALEFVKPLAGQRKITLHESIEAVTLLADAQKLSQVLVNLLTNAIQHNPEGTAVTLSLKRETDRVVLRVSDNGKGIPSEALPHLFERFFRAEKSRSRANGGTGLGLAICKAIVKAHGGRIRAHSQPGQGSEFIVELLLNQSRPV